jgi:hypothetical protein
VESCHLNYFPPSELVCKCGCGLYNFSPLLLDIINAIRYKLGKPLIAKSGCRCIPWNEHEGGTDSSDHLTGEGVDLKAIHSHTRFIILEKAFEFEIRRIGLAKTFIHLGINKNNPQEVFWIY